MNERFEWLYYHEVDKGPPDPTCSALLKPWRFRLPHNAPRRAGQSSERWFNVPEPDLELHRKETSSLWHVTQRVVLRPIMEAVRTAIGRKAGKEE